MNTRSAYFTGGRACFTGGRAYFKGDTAYFTGGTAYFTGGRAYFTGGTAIADQNHSVDMGGYGWDISHFQDMVTRQDRAAGACSFRAGSSCARVQRSRAPCARGTPNNGGSASPRSARRGRGWQAVGKTERRCEGFDK